MTTSKIKLFEPNVGEDEEKAVVEVLRSGYWASGSGVGKVGEFESEFAKYVGCKNVVAVNSGTAALHLALSLLDIKDREVILPALSFVSTANAILYNGGTPMFADVCEDTLCLDPDTLFPTHKTACIIPVHFGGLVQNHDYKDPLDRKMPQIEDSAHVVRRNSITNTTCFSFHPIKNLAMPTGGAIASNDDLEPLRGSRWCGITERNGSDYDVKKLGWNYYMNEISAAVGLVQLKKLDMMNQRRNEIGKMYSEGLEFDKMPYSKDCPYHFYWILVNDRDKFRKKMAERGIETGTHYKPIDQFTLYKRPHTLTSDSIAERIVTLPTHTNLSDSDVDVIIKTANS